MAENLAKPTEGTVADRFESLDSHRSMKLERARYMAALTIPSLLPPEGYTNASELPKPFSSVAARGVTNMASRMLAALLPMNDLPFFKFEMRDGSEPTGETLAYMEAMASQVHSRLSSKNMRESIFLTLQHLITAGDGLLVMDDDFSFRVYRLDQYVTRRDIDGSIVELIYLDWKPKEPNSNAYEAFDNHFFPSSWNARASMEEYEAYFNRVVFNKETDKWDFYSEDSEGNMIDEGSFESSPFMPLRWIGVTGEDYGRSHVEEVLGDIETLEAYTESMIKGMVAASTFWIGVDPASPVDVDDLAGYPSGSFVGVRPDNMFTISPAQSLSPQLSASQTAVETMRREVAQAFLTGSAGVRSAERVTATEVRMMGMEIENVLGGAFSAIARSMLEPIVKRTITLMLRDGELDERLREEFTINGRLSVNVVTGLQALSRDADLQKLMQLGEMVRNLPPEALSHFRWDEYGKALIGSLGFDPRNWILSEEELGTKRDEQAAKAAQQQANAAMSQGIAQGVGGAAQQGIMMAAQQAMAQGGMPPGAEQPMQPPM